MQTPMELNEVQYDNELLNIKEGREEDCEDVDGASQNIYCKSVI